ncbi:Repeat domain-containing protein [Catalinimonas alkaloidigena]|uniref:Repeat domain-containing protein n=1 Tax=Catalinimonas alkaloidigena TaxID=1075417 RepID=A0A1G9C0I4_9BACT|nr:VCBS repeat-containing protein [Catalinimonas alkaloidigena]SDK45202.1 Repeat domain-containing protein [Catalinimonas alkaloidigena]
MMQRLSLLLCVLMLLGACQTNDRDAARPPQGPTLFEALSPAHTQVSFANRVTNQKEFNIFNYRNFYNGGGVAIGDVNGDSLPDLFLISNLQDNKLYLNQGDLRFRDVTDAAGVAGKRAWSTGATLADVNGDGWLDLYVCNAGNGDDRTNELYINQGLSAEGVPTFTEQAAAYGLADNGYSTHAAFFDYDRDGDLDLYLLNNSFIPVGRLGYENVRERRDPLGGDKLFRNDGGHFTDVSEDAGIYGSLIGFGLGITIGDVNNDNWLDIYISNDFYERDYLYINQQDGTFSDESKTWMGHESLSSMGADMADLNNDGHQDIFVTDMLPGDDKRLKTTSTFESYDLQQLKLARDFHYQYMQNMLHLNNGNNTFSEVARLSGVAATDWSWGALLFDMDNDGLKDIFVANGVARDVTDQDFVNFLANEDNMRQMAAGKRFDYREFLDMVPASPIPNYAFHNEGGLQFRNRAQEWGLGQPGFSNGAAYGDLDGDGDLDLVVNNIDTLASIYRNTASDRLQQHYLRVGLKGYDRNRNGIGTKVYVHQPQRTLYLQQMPNRGFQSSVDLTLVFGLGNEARIDSVTVIWPDDRQQVLHDITADRTLWLDHAQADRSWQPMPPTTTPLFTDATRQVHLDYTHQESSFVDYNRDPLLKQRFSTQGPALAVGDIDGDGLDDVFLGGAAGQSSQLFLQQANGTFRNVTPPLFAEAKASEDVDALFFDADEDGDQDLYVVTGSNEFAPNAPELIDRLYLNDGHGRFTLDTELPNLAFSGSCVAAADFDRDGDMDLFVGGRLVPGQYGQDPPSYLYINNGHGSFKNYTKRYLPANELGMITDACWADVDGDDYPELVVVGDWMPVTIYQNVRGKSLEPREVAGSAGWWNALEPADLDGDGDLDFVLGNLGRNSHLRASAQQPAELYVHDFDGNGVVEQLITTYKEDGNAYPMILKHDLQKQMPNTKKNFVKYADYAGKRLEDIFTPEELAGALQKQVVNPNTCLLRNDGGQFTLEPLPVEAQVSPVCGIQVDDFDGDGQSDILLAGNFFDVLPEIGRYDASYGLVLCGKKDGSYQPLRPQESGFFTRGQVRHVQPARGRGEERWLILAKNDAAAQVMRYAPAHETIQTRK